MEIKATKRAMDFLIEDILLKKKTLRLAMVEDKQGHLRYDVATEGGAFSLNKYNIANVQNGTRLVLSCILISRTSAKHMENIEIDYDLSQKKIVITGNTKVVPVSREEHDAFVPKE